VENKKKAKKNKESQLPNRLYSKNFIVTYGFIEQRFGVFFGLSAKSANNVKRNRVKRVFRDLIKKQLRPFIDDKRNDEFSICLISKKGIKFGNDIAEIREELEDLVERVVNKIR